MNELTSSPPPTLNDMLAAALHFHYDGQFNDAEALYRLILAAPSPHASASYGLGMLCFAKGDLHEALDAYRRTIAIHPDDVEAITNLATSLLALGRSDEAVAEYQRAIAIRPDYALAHANLGKAFQDRGQIVDAVSAYRHAIRLKPDDAMAHANLGGGLLEQQLYAQAAEASEQAIALRPDLVMAHANLATAMFRLGRHHDALSACQRAIDLQPADATIYATLGGVLLEVGAFQEAAAACRRAVAINPAISMAHFNLAHACKAENRLAEAQAACRDAVALDPDRADHHFLLAHLLLLQGDFTVGWTEYEWRWRLPDFAWLQVFQTEVGQSPWKGEALDGKTILLLGEQGLGDIILFVRYAWLVAERGARVIIAVHQPMHRLLSSIKWATIVDLASRPLPHFDVYCPLVSLPGLVGPQPRPVISTVPYLSAERALRTVWRRRLGPCRPFVGIVWGGNPETKYDRLRSPGLAAMRPLFDVPGVTFVILQVGPARDEMTATPLPPRVIDLGGELDDLATTAAIMSELDLVISSCTAPLHLAGALGVPTWALLPFAPYFPWLLDRNDTDWYPTMRLYRQDEAGTDWSAVIARMRDELRIFAEPRAA